MESTKFDLFRKSVQRDSTMSVRYTICSAIGGILCITGTLTHEELLAYVWLGKYFILWWIGLAYRVWAEDSRAELRRISAQ